MSVFAQSWGRPRIQQYAFVVLGPRFRGDDLVIISRNDGQTKKPGLSTGPFPNSTRENRLRGFIRNRGIVAIGIGIDLALGISVRLGFGLGLGAAARALGELGFDFLDRLCFG